MEPNDELFDQERDRLLEEKYMGCFNSDKDDELILDLDRGTVGAAVGALAMAVAMIGFVLIFGS